MSHVEQDDKDLEKRLKAQTQKEVASHASTVNVNIEFPVPRALVPLVIGEFQHIHKIIELECASERDVEKALNRGTVKAFLWIQHVERAVVHDLAHVMSAVHKIVSLPSEKELNVSIRNSIIHKFRADYATTREWPMCLDEIRSLKDYPSPKMQESLIRLGNMIFAMYLMEPPLSFDWELSFSRAKFPKNKAYREGTEILLPNLIHPAILYGKNSVMHKGDVL